MANLTKVGNHYESEEISVEGDFNIHVESNGGVRFDCELFQKTPSGSNVKFAPTHTWRSVNGVLDVDCLAAVAKTIKVITNKPCTLEKTE